jgi:rod shape determining protein RodA
MDGMIRHPSRYAARSVHDRAKIFEINWLLVALVTLLGLIGVAMILAASDGNWRAGAFQHLVRISVGLVAMLGLAFIDIRIWYRLAYPAYAGALALLIGVELFGVVVNGSQRWLDLGVMRLQPSEIMKPAIVLALARYYHDLPDWRVSSPLGLMGALFLIAAPMSLILRQPDLGTTLLLVATGIIMIFLAGIKWRVVGMAVLGAAIAVPLFFRYGLQDYQRERILTAFDPDRDPLGASYHITQSKIALGSGGVSGKGYMQGTQRQLDYVPENRTDFIFTVIGEEFGLIGGLGTMAIYAGVMGICVWLSTQTKQRFSQLMILGLTATFSLYVFINLAMVMGLVPVVGVPLPLISYGGTVILAVMAAFGLMLSAHLYRETELPRGQL